MRLELGEILSIETPDGTGDFMVSAEFKYDRFVPALLPVSFKLKSLLAGLSDERRKRIEENIQEAFLERKRFNDLPDSSPEKQHLACYYELQEKHFRENQICTPLDIPDAAFETEERQSLLQHGQ